MRYPEEELNPDKYFCSDTIHLKAVFAESEKYRLIEEYGIDCCTPYKNNGLLFERDFVSYKNMQQWIFSFGDKVTVLEPEELVRERLEQAVNIISQKNYER